MGRDAPQSPTHEDLWKEIRNVERQMRIWVTGAIGSMCVIGFGAFAAVWKDQGEQRELMGAVTEKVVTNGKAVETAMLSQGRVEARLDEIARFLREDSREQRDNLSDHVRTMHPGR